MFIIDWIWSSIISILPLGLKTEAIALENTRKLRDAVDQKSLGKLRYLLGRGNGQGNIDVNTRDDGNRTVLHYISAYRGSMEEAKIVIANGADVYAKDEEGNTPLHLAAMSSNIELINFLLEVQFNNIYSSVTAKEAPPTDLGSVNDLGQTPFHLVKNLKAMRALLSSEGKNLIPIINREVSEEYRVATLAGYIKKDENGNTPLHIAAQSGKIKITRLLLVGRSFLLNIRNNMGQTALDLAANNHHDVIAYFLRNNGAKASGLVSKIDRTISVNSKDKKGATALHRAIADIGKNLLLEEFLRSRLEAIDTLLADGADVNLVDFNGNTPLHLAARCVNAPEITFKLLSRGANPNVKTKISNVTPLHEAALRGDSNTIEQLISYSAQVEAQDTCGLTPFFWVLTNSNQQVGIHAARVLIAHGANIEQKIDGETALHRAVKLGATETVKFLVERGADVNAVDGKKRTALDLARTDERELILFLKQNGAKTSEDFFGIISSLPSSLLNPSIPGASNNDKINALMNKKKIIIREKTYLKILEKIKEVLIKTGIGAREKHIATKAAYELSEAMWKKILWGDTTSLNFCYRKLLKGWQGSGTQVNKFIKYMALAMEKLEQDEDFKTDILGTYYIELDDLKKPFDIPPSPLLVNATLQAIGNSSSLLGIR